MTFFGAISKKQSPLALPVLVAILCAAFFFGRARHATVNREAITIQEVDCEISLNRGKATNRRMRHSAGLTESTSSVRPLYTVIHNA